MADKSWSTFGGRLLLTVSEVVGIAGCVPLAAPPSVEPAAVEVPPDDVALLLAGDDVADP